MSAPPLNGLLLLDKPVGLSSNAALQTVRRLAGRIKAGHCGSLDPLASGMLPICLGEATRLAGELLDGDKVYRFGIRLGERTDTGDAEGAVIERQPVPELAVPAVESVLAAMHGVQSQIPPMYSALKRDGQPLYRLARAGITVERAARSIRIERLRLLTLEPDWLELAVHCSKGTYVRVLAEDIARRLGTCGRLTDLRRDYVEPFGDDPLVTLSELEGLPPSDWPMLPADRAVAHLPALRLMAPEAQALRCGQVIALPQAARPVQTEAPAAAAGERWRLYDEQARFMGLGSSTAGVLRVQRLFSAPLAV